VLVLLGPPVAQIRAVVVALPILAGGYLLSYTDLAIAVLLLAVFGRMYLRPAQVCIVSCDSCGH
jgi:hypothetical protein